MTTITVTPTVTEAVNDLLELGYSVPAEVLAKLEDKRTRRALASGGMSDRSMKLFAQLSPEMYAEAAKGDKDRGPMTLSQWLEREDPTEPGTRDEMLGIDAFSRMVNQLRTRGGEALRLTSGYGQQPAHTLGDFLDAGAKTGNVTQGAILFPELGRRAWVEGGAVGSERFSGKMFYASNAPLWEGLNPQYLSAPIAGEPRLRRPLLNDLIAIRTTVAADTFKFPSITNQAAQSRYRRIAEGTPVPIVSLTVSMSTGYIYKFGCGIEVTDEAARRLPIDIFRYHLARIGAQNAEDKSQVAGELAIASVTAETDISTIGGVANTVESTPLDNFLALFEEDGYVPTISIGPRATTTLLKNATTGTANQSVFKGPQAVMTGGARNEELDHPPIYTRTWGATGKMLYVDGTAALGEATEQGATKQETDRDIVRGVNRVVLSEVVGYYAINAAAMRLLDTAH